MELGKAGHVPAREAIMFAGFRHRAHHFGALIYTSFESAFLTAGAGLILLVLLLFYFGLLWMKQS
jgi:hypothetical protein